MGRNWKTNLCGILGALCAALALITEMPAVATKIFVALGPFFGNLGLMFARDFNVSSEQSGCVPKGGPVLPGTGVALLNKDTVYTPEQIAKLREFLDQANPPTLPKI